MRLRDASLVQKLGQRLADCHREQFPLPGVQSPVWREVFLRQLVDSIRRVEFVSVIAQRGIHPNRANALSDIFDPVRAAVLRSRSGDFDEACWLAFLFVHFGKHPVSGYRYVKEFYSALAQRPPWTFHAVSADVTGMKQWLDTNEAHLRRGASRGFGNHRKYVSLSGSKKNGTGHAFETYCGWVGEYGSHAGLFNFALRESRGSAESAFDWLYRSMREVASYGRIGRFDYLTMLGKLNLVEIRPGRPYLDSSSKGPNKGARLLLESGGAFEIAELDRRIQTVGQCLGVGMQEMEDALCNWGKSPGVYRYFKG